ncbi:primase-helicase zinc-binding domain-containing protein [Solidesulfovibrio sp. C21]|uniref:primase-helicase zinc-binding domain-containing protein n=1 Tax=Solidesulfovibrio sp. C21 TaxID=3398613 RepID=UPI0039FBB2FD
MNLLDLIPAGLKYVSGTSGGEWAGPCPWCAGTDRFRVWPDHPSGATGGRFLCRGCGRQGDGIQFLRDMDGLSYPEACKRMGTTPKATGTTRTLKPASWEPKAATLPVEAWVARAGQFVNRCAAALAAGGPGLEYARSRGLTAKTCAALRIGWNPSDLYEDRAAWGLPEEINLKTGKPRRVWLSAGLVIPTLRGGQVVAIKIRRSAWTPEDQFPKYAAVSGGGKLPMVLAPDKGKPCVVVESELDAILAAQEARDAVSCAALGTAKGKPDATAHTLFMAAPVVLVALDFDEAGAGGWPWWREHYASAKRWPPSSGKDVGDLMTKPGMVREWILAGLPQADATGLSWLPGAPDIDHPDFDCWWAAFDLRDLAQHHGLRVVIAGGRLRLVYPANPHPDLVSYADNLFADALPFLEQHMGELPTQEAQHG